MLSKHLASGVVSTAAALGSSHLVSAFVARTLQFVLEQLALDSCSFIPHCH